MNPETFLEAQQPCLLVHSPRTQQPQPGWELSTGTSRTERCLHILWAHWECQTTAWCVQSLPQPRYSLFNWLIDEYYFSMKVLHLSPNRIPGLLPCTELLPCQSILRCNLQLSPQCHLVCDITKQTLEILRKSSLVAAYPSLTPPSCCSSTSQTIETVTWMQNSLIMGNLAWWGVQRRPRNW